MTETETESQKRKSTLVVALVAAIAGALLTLAIVAHPDMDDDDEEERVASVIPPATSSSVDLGDLAAANGIEVSPLAPATGALEETAYGTVADTTELIDLVRQDEALAARITEASTKAEASANEETRLAALNADDHNASDRALELARAEAAADRAALEAVRSESRALRRTASRRWGRVAEAVLDRNARTAGLLAGRDTLIELALRSGVTAPAHVRVASSGPPQIEAELLGPIPRVDPQLQQRVYLYLAAASELPGGLNVTVSVPTDEVAEGVIVPKDAVVWSSGAAWVFLEVAEGRYERRRVAATRPDNDGFFETGLRAGDRVVTRGAQQLLSQQHKPEPED